MPNRFKDYIATPKPNMYQSLHTTVFSEHGAPFEIQIRTHEMHKLAEYGIAAHWKYKEGGNKSLAFDKKIAWLREALEYVREAGDSQELVDTLKVDLFADEVFVFTPQGDIIDMPFGANSLDFAYKIHSEVGNKCIGAKVNSKLVPLGTQLNSGDIVEIITSNNSRGPSRDWLKIVKTSDAKSKIRQFFKKEMKEENIKRGREMLELEAKKRGYNLSQLLETKILRALMEKFTLSSLDDMYASVGYGGLTTGQIIIKLVDYYNMQVQSPVKLAEKTKTVQKKSDSAISVMGFDDFSIRLSRCCNPVPGDAIIGYVSRGRGVSIHRADCPNMRNVEVERIVNAAWSNAENTTYQVSLQMNMANRAGMLADITAVISNQKLSIVSISARVIDRDKTQGVIHLTIEINNTAELIELMRKLKQIEGVTDVFRAAGQ